MRSRVERRHRGGLDQDDQPFALVALAGFGVCLVLRLLAVVLDNRAPKLRGPANV